MIYEPFFTFQVGMLLTICPITADDSPSRQQEKYSNYISHDLYMIYIIHHEANNLVICPARRSILKAREVYMNDPRNDFRAYIDE